MLNQQPQLKGVKMTSAVLTGEAEANTGYRFSWGLAVVGGVAATAITFFLLTLGSGLGLMLVRPLSSANPTVGGFLTGGAIYFFVAQAFGFAVGGHLAGRLLGPIVESDTQEAFRAVAHGLASWCVAVLATLTMVGIAGASVGGSGASIAALYAFQAPKAETSSQTPYLVDVLFRPEVAAVSALSTDTQTGGLAISDGATNAQARAEAGRILATALMLPQTMKMEEQDRLATLTANAAGISSEKARSRIVALEADVRAKAAAAAEYTRRVVRDASLWLAASLFFGALVAMLSAVLARIEDDRESIVGTFYKRRV